MATSQRDQGIPGMYPIVELMSDDSVVRLWLLRASLVRQTVTRPVWGKQWEGKPTDWLDEWGGKDNA